MSALDELVAQIGQEQVDEIVGEWLAKSHRDRPRLFWAKPTSPARAPHYIAFVRQLQCRACGAPPPNDPHHHGGRGVGQKTDDYRTVPLCRACHDRVHRADTGGPDRWQLDRMVLETLVQYLRLVEKR